MHLDQFLTHFKGAKPGSNGNTMVICPAHDDSTPSLSITEKNNTILMRCMAGCPTKLVVEKAGLKMVDLMNHPKAKIIATYNYLDEQGTLLFRVVRRKDKSFGQHRPDGNGGWVGDMEGVRKVLYRLPELLASTDPYVLMVEGEKDVDRLRGLGFTATTNPGGAGKWLDEYVKSLVGRTVFILPDNDVPGHAHAQTILKSVLSSQIVELPDLPHKGDVSQWLDAGHTLEELWCYMVVRPQKLEEIEAKPTCDNAEGHDYQAVTITGIKDALAKDLHLAMLTEQCRYCFGLRITKWKTNQWFEVNNEISN